MQNFKGASQEDPMLMRYLLKQTNVRIRVNALALAPSARMR